MVNECGSQQRLLMHFHRVTQARAIVAFYSHSSLEDRVSEAVTVLCGLHCYNDYTDSLILCSKHPVST